ncbi:MAG: Rab family GTPase [Candidatus Hodarchaeales archaeon]|jgi:small GTP-binding protein
MKICIVGDGAVGKTSLRDRYLGRGFKSTYIMTVGADFSVKEEIINNEVLKFQIWDLAGQPKFDNIRKLYYKGSRGFLIVFDVTRPTSYENITTWIDEIKKYNKEDLPTVLIGNKIDIRDDSNPVHITKEITEKFLPKIAQEMNNGKIPVTYIETSAKTGDNVDYGFKKLSEGIYDHFVKNMK